MGKTTIEWCDYTFNHVRGCTKIAAGCANCYADTLSNRNPATLGIWGPNGTRVIASEAMWREPLAWNAKAHKGVCRACNGGRKKVTHESGYGYEHCELRDGGPADAPPENLPEFLPD